MLFTIIVLSAVAMGVYLPYIVGEHEKDEERSLKDRGSIDKIQEDEDMWNDDIGQGVGEYYELLQERYDKAFTVPSLDRDASYMRELAQKRHDELLPIWEEKADDDVYNILDVIESHINELTDVSDNTYSMPYGWRERFQMYNFHEDENVRMLVMEKLGGLGFEVTVKETIRPYYLYEVRLEETLKKIVISWREDAYESNQK